MYTDVIHIMYMYIASIYNTLSHKPLPMYTDVIHIMYMYIASIYNTLSYKPLPMYTDVIHIMYMYIASIYNTLSHRVSNDICLQTDTCSPLHEMTGRVVVRNRVESEVCAYSVLSFS